MNNWKWKLQAAQLFLFANESFENVKGIRILYLITGHNPVKSISFAWLEDD